MQVSDDNRASIKLTNGSIAHRSIAHPHDKEFTYADTHDETLYLARRSGQKWLERLAKWRSLLLEISNVSCVAVAEHRRFRHGA